MDFDFNTAAPQDERDIPASRENRQERLDRIRRSAQIREQEILFHLFPRGRIEGKYFKVGNTNGDPGDSLSYCFSKDGVWKDFADDEESGKGLIDLWMAARKCDFKSALDEMERFLSLDVQASTPTNTINFEQEKKKRDIGPPVATYYYRDADGKIILSVAKHINGKGKKEFIPWNPATRKHEAPEIRPLYNQPGIAKATRVILVEGEKCADALIAKGICATTAMGGAKADPKKTDWSPLAGKDVLIWPDNDKPGKEYAENVQAALRAAGVKVKIIALPEGKSEKWDAADAIEEGMDVQAFLSKDSSVKRSRLYPKEWCVSKAYQGQAPERRWLVNCTMPMGAVTILAAAGDAGKGMLGIDLALKVACKHKADLLNPFPVALGNSVCEHGSAVIFTVEDDQEEVHRRLEQIDRNNLRVSSEGRLMIVPLPNAGGPFPLVVSGKNGPEWTPQFFEVREYLFGIPDLKLVIFDPLASFVAADINADPAVGSFTTGLLSSLAAETGAAVVVAHHMNKGHFDKPIYTPEQARQMIRGTTAIVDGVRAAYALWATDVDRAKRVCRLLQTEWQRNRVFSGAICKGNGPVDRSIKTFVRNECGLLVVMDDVLKSIQIGQEDLNAIMVQDIARAAIGGRPFTVSGESGLYNRKEELSPELRGLGRQRIELMAKDLLDLGKIGKSNYKGSGAVKWLDVPGGPFQQGIGEFMPGFEVN